MGLWFSRFTLPSVACTIWAAGAFLVLSPPVSATTISGQARFVGAVPNGRPIPVTKDQDYCGQTIPNESYLLGPGQGLKNVVVYLESLSESPVNFEFGK